MSDTQTTLRDSLEASYTAAENGTLAAPTDAPAITDTPAVAATAAPAEPTDGRRRDEHGRFATNPDGSPVDDGATVAAAPGPGAQQSQAQTSDPLAGVQRPTTWKKEYLPLYDKLASGAPLTVDEGRKLAAYNMQRETEAASGIRMYRERAEQARDLAEAVEPFKPLLQQHNMAPGDWIKSLGEAQRQLLTGTPQEKLQMFVNLAASYGVPLGAVQATAQGLPVDPAIPQFMQQMQEMRATVAGVEQFRQSREQEALQQEISVFEDTAKYPHFPAVRERMAQLLETGNAQTLADAYDQAIWLDPEVRQAEIARQAPAPVATAAPRPNAVAAARNAAVSTKSAIPAGTAAAVNPSDRRSQLSASFDALAGGRV